MGGIVIALIKDLLDENIQKYGEYSFIYYGDQTYSNLDALKHANQIAHGLRNLGIQQGDRVLVCMPNCPEVLFSYQGITRAGAIIVPVMYLLHAHEIEYIIKASRAKAVITSSELLPKIKESVRPINDKPFVLVCDDFEDSDAISLSNLTKQTDADTSPDVSGLTENDPAVILFTSGTTGKPKGVILTHKNLYSNASASLTSNPNPDRITTIGILPLAHVFGLTVSNVLYLRGSSIVVFSKFDPEKVFAAIEKYKVTSFSVVPAMVYAMLNHPNADKYDLSSLEKLGSGSAALPDAIRLAFKEKFNVDVYDGYGLSEAAPAVSGYRDGMPYKKGSVGVPIEGVEIRIVDPNDREVPVGEVGELIVRGDNVTPGYFENEEETARVLKNGWLHTGDMAKLDEEGFLYIVDRKKDLIIRGGFNIYPRDIEELLSAHPAVLENAVIGVPDERMGEEVLAFVVKKPGSDVTQQELIEYCQAHIAKNKSPRNIVFIDSLPRNGVGKILKTRLRDYIATGQPSQS
ncbi:class I adenylate-forming enzyme family protein [Neobacillus sp. Marseille-QA0830]